MRQNKSVSRGRFVVFQLLTNACSFSIVNNTSDNGVRGGMALPCFCGRCFLFARTLYWGGKRR